MSCENIIGSCRRAHTCKGRLALKVRFSNMNIQILCKNVKLWEVLGLPLFLSVRLAD